MLIAARASLRVSFALLACTALPHVASAQNASGAKARPITSTDVKNWNTIRQNVLSNDGKWFAYTVGPAEGDLTVAYRSTAGNATETRVPVGATGGSIQISADSKWLGFLVTPNRPAVAAANGRGGGRGGAPGGAPGATQGGGQAGLARAADSMANNQARMVLVNLATGLRKDFNGIRRFSFNGDSPKWVVMSAGGAPAGGGGGGGRGGPPGGAPAADGPVSGGGADLLLYNVESGERQNMGRVGQYDFSEDGEWLAYTMENTDQIGNAVQIRNMTTGVIKSLDSEDVLYRHLAWTDSSRALSVMKGKIMTTGTRDTVFSLALFRGIGANGAATIKTFTPAGRSDFPAGFKLASNRAPRYSGDLSMAFFGIREALKTSTTMAGGRGGANPLIQAGAPGAGGTINQTAAGRGASGTPADSLPSLILWHGKDDRLQSQQMVQEAADRAFSYTAEYRFDDDKFLRLADDKIRNVTVVPNEKFAYGVDNTPYAQAASYSGRNYNDYYAVDLKTGAKKLIWKRRATGIGAPSPDGTKALMWGADGHYWVLNLNTLDSVNITRTVATSFIDREDDHYNIQPRAIPARGWSKDGNAVLLSDNWDLWQVPVSGSGRAVNLTGDGKRAQIRYRQLYNWGNEAATTAGGGGGGGGGFGGPAAPIDLSKPLYIGTYGEWTKKEGVSRVDPGTPGAKSILFEDARFAITKAKDADTYAFSRQTFTEFPDYWVSAGDFKSPRRMTDANPQVKDLAMSSGTRLINYTSDKGDKLQAAMYLPADFDPSKKYPMLVTIYEKRSQNKNGFVNPSETQTPSARMYTSRGYIVLDPDIVYKINDPGMSAVWSVVPAVKAAIATGHVDAANVGLWGHSWGGYQTAFLVTQTNIFKSAIAGAALTDMVSMYSSVYWNTGGSNQAIFESSQGRFKGNFIDNYDAYIRNSPAFHANKQKTPLILLHNDKDGAVDFNQGITHFNTLRQLGKDVILLEYVGENHGLARPVNQKDYAQRQAEWFDHYLMGKPAPEWMVNGIPRLQMADHLQSRKDSTAATGRVIVP